MGKKRADAYAWYRPVPSTKRLLVDTAPYLKLKSEQALLVLESIDKKEASARGKRLGKGSSPLTQEEIEFRERLRKQVRLLNRKGKYAREIGGGLYGHHCIH